MNASLLKRLFRAARAGSVKDIEISCRRIIDDEKSKGHLRVAEDLERILGETDREWTQQLKRSLPTSLSPLPTNPRDASTLVREIPHTDLRHHIILPTATEQRFQRVEKELAARTRLASYGLRARQRILLFGPPGCGKSLGAERLAWSTGLPLRKVRFDTLLSSFFGETLTNLRRVFDDAEKSPCALFLDECDTLARTRTDRNDVGEINRITNALLELLESSTGEGLVIAATNLDSALDPALFRRFDEVLKIPLPAVGEIERLLAHSLSAIKTGSELPLSEIAHQMDGMSCSEVVQVAHNAAKDAVLNCRDTVQTKDIQLALKEHLERNSH